MFWIRKDLDDLKVHFNVYILISAIEMLKMFENIQNY